MAISVNMFGLRLTSDIQPRTKNGQPAQTTTGVAQIRPTAFAVRMLTAAPNPGIRSAIEVTSTGADSTAAIQNRRVIVTSSGLGPSSNVTTLGSSAMPQ